MKRKKTSNQDWIHPGDPDAKVAKMKDGRTHLAHKAEHAVDIDSGGDGECRGRATRRRAGHGVCQSSPASRSSRAEGVAHLEQAVALAPTAARPDYPEARANRDQARAALKEEGA